MKFICDKILLSNAIDGVSKAVTNRSAIPVLEGILLKAEGFQLTLTGYDMEIGITTTIESNVLVPGETVLNAKQLGDIIHRMPAGEVELELSNNGTVTIKGGVAEFEIPAMMAGDYPNLPNPGADHTTTMPCAKLADMLNKTLYAVSQDEKKPAHTGELCHRARQADHCGAGRLSFGHCEPRSGMHPRYPHYHSRQNPAGAAQADGR